MKMTDKSEEKTKYLSNEKFDSELKKQVADVKEIFEDYKNNKSTIEEKEK